MNRLLLVLLALAAPGLAGAGELSPLLLHPPASRDGAAFAPDDGRVTIRLAGPVDAGALAALRRAGATPVRLPSGGPAAVGPLVSATVPRHRLAAVAALPGVVSVAPARPLVRGEPLDRTTAQVEAPRLWWPPADELAGAVHGNLGAGVVIADHELAWDPFHPDLFRLDAGRYDFEDVDRDGVAGRGDRVDLDGDGVFEAWLSLLDADFTDPYAGTYGEIEPGYQPGFDWLYVDENGDGERNVGAREGFSDAVPAFGEPIFAAEDADGSGGIEPGEKLLRLGTSKVAAISFDRAGHDAGLYRRGVNLASFPYWELEDFRRSHGTAVLGILAGGWPGVRRYTGFAPEADLVLVGHDDLVSSVAAAAELGAHVNVHEYDEFVAPQDGSSAVEVAITENAATGPVHVAAAGNLAGTEHFMEVAPLGAELAIARYFIDGGMYGASYTVLSWTGAPADVAWALVAGDGSRLEGGTRPYLEGRLGGVRAQVWQEATAKGNTWLLVYLAKAFATLPELTVTVEARATGAEVARFRGLVTDDRSGWGPGVRWLDHVTDDGSALSPSTSDRVIAVAAHGGIRPESDEIPAGVRRPYSGMGPRLDGAPVIDLSGPDDPTVPRSDSGTASGYRSFGGTSGATPHVGGAAALILAERPALDHDAIEALLRDGALRDEFTGDTPNERYGYGKVRVARALGLGPTPAGEAPRVALSAPRATAGEPVEVVASVAGPPETLLAFDAGNDGVEEAPAGPARTFRFVPDRAGPVAVAARAIDPAGRQGRKVLLVEVGAPVEEPDDDGGGSGGDGGGCSSTREAGAASWLPWLLAGALLGRRRR